MALRRLQVTDFRCLRSAELWLDPRFTLISGPNASGKTSLLEAIYVAGRGRSFRTRRVDSLIRRDASRFVVFGEIDLASRRAALGVEGSVGGMRARIDGQQPESLADLAISLPVQIIDPEVHRLIEEGPGRRRRFLDWGVFHVERGFVFHWQRYSQVLKQRNAALRARQPGELVTAWDVELVRHGEFLSRARAAYVGLLLPVATGIVHTLLGMELSLNYRPGWAQERSLGEALALSLVQDRERGVTQVGPQRGELAIRLDGSSVKDRISRGQQKLLAGALLLAQLKLFPFEGDVQPTLLLDDPAAELDVDKFKGLIHEVSGHDLQLVVTTLAADFAGFGTPGRRYTVRQGVVSEV